MVRKQRLNAPCRMFNVGVTMPVMDYTPRIFEEIINRNHKQQPPP